MRSGLFAALLLTGCGPVAAPDAAAGQALEAAAHDAGLIADAGAAGGVFSAGEDRICLTRGDGRAPYRIGASVDYGEGQRCVARGTAVVGGERLAVDFGNGCRFDAARDGDRLTFPARLPAGCARACQGRATLDALSVERLSEAAGEAARLRGADGRLLCAN